METDANSPAGLGRGGSFDANPSDYFGTAFRDVDGAEAGPLYVAEGLALSGGGFPPENHRPHQHTAAIVLFPYPEPHETNSVTATTVMMNASPELEWQGGSTMYDTALFPPSIDSIGESSASASSKPYYPPEYYGSWSHVAQPIMGMDLISPNTIEEQQQQQPSRPHPQPQLQPQHQDWGQTMTPPDDNFPLSRDPSRSQLPLSRHLGQGYPQLHGSNGISTRDISIGVGDGATSSEMAGFAFSQTVAGGQSQPSPVTSSDYLDSPATLVLSPQPATPSARYRLPSTSASSPPSPFTATATLRTVQGWPVSPSEDPDCATQSSTPRQGSTSSFRGGKHGVSRSTNSTDGTARNKRPTSTDDDETRGSGASVVVGKGSSRARGSNREAAKKCREKTRLNEQHLEDRERNVKARNNRLKRELDSVKEEVHMWRTHLLMHGSCNNPSINSWIRNRAAEISENASSLAPASHITAPSPATAPSRLQPLMPMPINGRLNFRLQPPPPPLTRRPTR